jgi:hypothetical protein
VRRGANRKKFAITKSEEGSMADKSEAIEILKAVIETPIEQEPNPAEIIKAALSDKALAAAKGIVRLASAFKDEPGMSEILGKLGAMAGVDEPKKQDKLCPDAAKKKSEDKNTDTSVVPKKAQADEDKDAKGKTMAEKSLEDLPEEMRTEVQQLWKSHKEAVEKAAKLEEVLKAERDERLQKEFIAKAASEYGELKADSKELGVILKSLHEANPEVAAKMEEVLKSANETIKNADVFQEIGTSASGSSGGNAWSKIEQMADSLVQKSDKPLSKAAAIDFVMKQNPSLYAEYTNENPRQYGEGKGV